MSSLFSSRTISSSASDTDVDDSVTDSAPIHKLSLINFNKEIEEQLLDASNELDDFDLKNEDKDQDKDEESIHDSQAKEFSSIFSYDDDSVNSYLAQSFETIRSHPSPSSTLPESDSNQEPTRGRTMERGTSTIRNTSFGTRFRNIIRQSTSNHIANC
ncbi:unnamed protein product [[Candida] boidinii]|nr:unnamed protein product [[Candida] boidinii]